MSATLPPPSSSSGVPDPVIAQLVKSYEATATRIRDLVFNPPGRSDGTKDFYRRRYAMLLNQIDEEVRLLTLRAVAWHDQALEDSIRRGVASAQAELARLNLPETAPGSNIVAATTATRLEASFARISTGPLEVLARHTARDLVKGATAIGDGAKVAVREARAAGLSVEDVNQAIARYSIIEGQPTASMRVIREKLRAVHGNTVAIPTKGGGVIQFDVGTYAEMVARTRTREAGVAAQHLELSDRGYDLVKIVGRVTKSFCTAYLGHVYSISGTHPNYPPLSSLPGANQGYPVPPFHPNCSKSTTPFVEHLATETKLQLAGGHEAAMHGIDTQEAQRRFRALGMFARTQGRLGLNTTGGPRA